MHSIENFDPALPRLLTIELKSRLVLDKSAITIAGQTAPGDGITLRDFTCVNNVFRPGPMTDPAKLPIAMKGGLPDLAKGHMSGNVFEGREDLTRDNYAALDFHRWLRDGSSYKYLNGLVIQF